MRRWVIFIHVSNGYGWNIEVNSLQVLSLHCNCAGKGNDSRSKRSEAQTRAFRYLDGASPKLIPETIAQPFVCWNAMPTGGDNFEHRRPNTDKTINVHSWHRRHVRTRINVAYPRLMLQSQALN
jgi:hypothetical protein